MGEIRHVAFHTSPSHAAQSVPASLCLTAAGTIGWAITTTTEGIQPPMTVNGQPTLADSRCGTGRRPERSEATCRRSARSCRGPPRLPLASCARGFLRAVLFGLLPALALLAVRCLALAADGQARRLGLWLYVIAALNAMAWAVITPCVPGA